MNKKYRLSDNERRFLFDLHIALIGVAFVYCLREVFVYKQKRVLTVLAVVLYTLFVYGTLSGYIAVPMRGDLSIVCTWKLAVTLLCVLVLGTTVPSART